MQRFIPAETSFKTIQELIKGNRPQEAIDILSDIHPSGLSPAQLETKFVLTTNCLFKLNKFTAVINHCHLWLDFMVQNEGLLKVYATSLQKLGENDTAAFYFAIRVRLLISTANRHLMAGNIRSAFQTVANICIFDPSNKHFIPIVPAYIATFHAIVEAAQQQNTRLPAYHTYLDNLAERVRQNRRYHTPEHYAFANNLAAIYQKLTHIIPKFSERNNTHARFNYQSSSADKPSAQSPDRLGFIRPL